MPKKTNIKSEVKVLALGGLGEVGKNTYVIEYAEKLYIIDAGILFPDDYLLGVDLVIPDYQYLVENQDRIVGLFITHGHEDHIGGIPFLLKQVKVDNIYASGIGVDFIVNKLGEHKGLHPKIIKYNSESVYTFGDLEISFVRLNHSIPDSFGIVFKTPLGNIFHTGDFKLDLTPVGPPAEYDKLTKLGKEGVLLLLSDSTNAMVEGYTESEFKIGNSIKDMFASISGRIIVATFASNIYRVHQIVEASRETNRKIAVFGRSMEKTIEIGQESGYISREKKLFIEQNEIKNYQPHEITLLCTGSQGEPLAALSRVANGTHKSIKLIPNDTVIFSSSPIPGNAEGVNRTINLLFKSGANVIIHSPITDTHTSGHAAQGELKTILSFTKPKYFMPVHGEYRMLKTHGILATECGVEKDNIFLMENGDTLIINEKEAKLGPKVRAGDIYIDGSLIGDISNSIIKERKYLSEEGVLALIIPINVFEKTLPCDPQLVSRGFVYMKENEKLTKNYTQQAKKFVLAELAKSKQVNLTHISLGLIDFMSKLITTDIDRNPLILPLFMPV